ncbi:hypothetical protein [Roseateles microcysteis]|uniref:hypothetical protein n=1 Tax=Roseateles microcysteis TaxID=3119057 RepID=UPI002FE65C28
MTTPLPWPRRLRCLATSLLLLCTSGLALADAETLLPDGRRIVLTNKTCSSCPNPAIKLVDANGKLLANLPAKEKELVLSTLALENGRYFVTATTGGEGMVRVYDLEKKLMSSSEQPFGSPQTWGLLYELGGNEFAVVSGAQYTYLKDAGNRTRLVIFSINDGKLKELSRLTLETRSLEWLARTSAGTLMAIEEGSRLAEYESGGKLRRAVQFDKHAKIQDLRLLSGGSVEALMLVGSNFMAVKLEDGRISYSPLHEADQRLSASTRRSAQSAYWSANSLRLRFADKGSGEIQLQTPKPIAELSSPLQWEALTTLADTAGLTYKAAEVTVDGPVVSAKLGRYSRRGWPVINRLLIYSNGPVYEGEVEADPSQANILGLPYSISSGRGRMVWPNGHQYSGDWLEGERTGRGLYSWPDGDYFDGHWVDNNRKGYGESVYADGRVNRGLWSGNNLTTRCTSDEECAKLNGGVPFQRAAPPARVTESTEDAVRRCAKAEVSNIHPGANGSADFYGECNIAGFATTGIVVTRHKGIPVDIACLKDSKPTEKSNTEAFVPCEKYWAFVPDYCQKDDYRGQCKDAQPHGVGFRTGRRGGSKPSMGSGTMGALLSAFAPVTNYTIYIESGMFREGKLQGYGTAKSASGCGAAGCSGERVNDIGWFKQGSKAFECTTYADCIPKLSGKDLSSERQAWLSASAAAGSAAGSDATKTFEAALSAYQAKGNKDDLKRAQALAASPAERARLEYTLMQLAGFDKVLTLSSRVEGSGKSAGTEDAERLLGFFRSVSSSIPVKFSWSLAPETALLPLKQGRYAVTLKVGLKVDKTHRTCLGAACSDRVGTVPYVREVQVVLDTTNGYRAKGSFELSLDGARTSALFGTESGEAISGFAGVASIESVKLLP